MSSGEWEGRDAVRELADLLRQAGGRGVHALVGAGISVGCASLPTWTELIEEIDPPMKSVGGKGARVRDPRVRQDLPWLAHLAEKAYLAEQRKPEQQRQPKPDVRGLLRRRFHLDALPKLLNDVLPRVLELPFQHILTTNYDNLLDLAHARYRADQPHRVLRWERSEDRSRFVGSLGRDDAERYYVHLHGRAECPEHCVLTEEDYRERYVRQTTTSRNLYAMFATQSVVFLGFSLEDVELREILREVQTTAGGADTRHYAILPRPKEGEAGLTAYFTGKYGVSPILYPNDDEKHAALQPLLEDLCEQVRTDAVEDDWAHVEVSLDPKVPSGQQDPNNGRFGGAAVREGFQLVVENVINWKDTWASFDVCVKGPAGTFDAPVAIYLHPTFPESVVRVLPQNGVARFSLHGWGAFTVGAVVKEPRLMLELDLAKDTRFNQAFLER
ncbi:hypothetical protein ABI59_20915 [Acidobacteria bacterium Mor1]|nr:hypothetical protein ABI59_20915 [Acidobacteria bacterium Mor1]